MSKVSPKNANTTTKVCSLKRDNYGCKNNWILVEEKRVTIASQVRGESPTGLVTISKKVFEQLIKFYETEQQTIKRKP